MAHGDNTIPVPKELVSNTPGGIVASSDAIFDYQKQAFQESLNNGILEEKDYDPESYSGKGRKVVKKNIVDGVNILTQSMINTPNTIYVIQYDFDLATNTITIPANCVLDFQGGSISNGTVNGDVYICGYKSGNAVFRGRTFKWIKPFKSQAGESLVIEILEGNVSDQISAAVTENNVLYNFERTVLIRNLDIYNTNFREGIAFSTKNMNNPHENLIDFVSIKRFKKNIELFNGGYSNICNSRIYYGETGVDIDGNNWVGAINIDKCLIRGNKTGISISTKASPINISECTFEWNLCDLNVGGKVNIRDCYFGDQSGYKSMLGFDDGEGYKAIVVKPGGHITISNCMLGLSVPDGFTKANCFLFDLQGTDGNPCDVTIENSNISLSNQYNSLEWLYKSLSSKNRIQFRNVTISVSANNQHTKNFPCLFDSVSGIIKESNNGINYVIDGYFQDSIQNAQLSKLSNVTVLDTMNIYGGKSIKITPYDVDIFYKIPAKYIGVTMRLEVNVVAQHNGNLPSVVMDESDCSEAGQVEIAATNGKSGINFINFTPTKEIGKINLYVGYLGESYPDPYIIIGYVRLVPKENASKADMFSSVNDIIYLPSTTLSADDITSYRDVYNENGKVERT